jgi:hypothetical protein
VKRTKPKKRPTVRLDPIYGWPLTGPDAPEGDGAVSDHLKQELLDWSDFWHEHADAEGVFDSEVVEAEYVHAVCRAGSSVSSIALWRSGSTEGSPRLRSANRSTARSGCWPRLLVVAGPPSPPRMCG